MARLYVFSAVFSVMLDLYLIDTQRKQKFLKKI